MKRARAGLIRRAIATGIAGLLPFASIPAARAWGVASPLTENTAPDSPPRAAPDSPAPGASDSPAVGDTTAEPVPRASATQTGDPEEPGEIGFDEPLRPSPGGPRVRLQADRPQTWLQKRFSENEWRDICTGACLIHPPPNGTYRLGGRSLRPTAPFQLPRSSGSVVIEGKMGTNARYYTGVGLTIGGVVEALGGVVLVVAASSATGQHSQDLSNEDFYTFTGIFSLIRAAVLVGLGMSFISKGLSSAEVR